eukprot:gene4203-4451_t
MLQRSCNAADTPHSIHRALQVLNRSFVKGRQEDAHELLRCLVDAMERALLRQSGTYNPQKPPKYPRSLVNQLFSGILQSQVRCDSCGHASNTWDPFMDLCEGCKQLVPACKQMMLYDDPNVLVIHLKRFDGIFGAKITRAGFSANSGHYFAYCRDGTPPAGLWHCMNDSTVYRVHEDEVLRQSAYILFYVRTNLAPAAAVAQLSALTSSGGRSSKDSVVLTSTALQRGHGSAEQLLDHIIMGWSASAERDSITLQIQSPAAQRLLARSAPPSPLQLGGAEPPLTWEDGRSPWTTFSLQAPDDVVRGGLLHLPSSLFETTFAAGNSCSCSHFPLQLSVHVDGKLLGGPVAWPTYSTIRAVKLPPALLLALPAEQRRVLLVAHLKAAPPNILQHLLTATSSQQLQVESRQESLMVAGAALLALAAAAENDLQDQEEGDDARPSPSSSHQAALGEALVSAPLPSETSKDAAVEHLQQQLTGPQLEAGGRTSCNPGKEQLSTTNPTTNQQLALVLPEGASLSDGFSLPSLHSLNGEWQNSPRSLATTAAMNAAEQALLQLLDQLEAPDCTLLQLEDLMSRLGQFPAEPAQLQRFKTDYSRVQSWVNRRNVQQVWRAVLRLLDDAN